MSGKIFKIGLRTILLSAVVLSLGACASSDDKEAASQPPVTENPATNDGLSDRERQVLLAIFANPEGQQTSAAEPQRTSSAEASMPSRQPAPGTDKERTAGNTMSAYEAWYGNKQAEIEPSAPDRTVGSDPFAPQPSNETIQASASVQEKSLSDAGNPVGVLPPQRLDGGTCGMFLWKPDDTADAIFFSYGAQGAARMNIRSKIVEMERVSVGGMTLFGQFERQSFAADGVQVELTAKFALPTNLRDGAEVSHGRLDVTEDGRQRISLPVAGKIGCQSAEATEQETTQE